jgi:hypothetical protein
MKLALSSFGSFSRPAASRFGYRGYFYFGYAPGGGRYWRMH